MKILYVCTVPTERSGIPIVIFNLLGSIVSHIDQEIRMGYVSINKPEDSFSRKLMDWNIDHYVVKRSKKNPLRYIRQLTNVAKGYDIMHVHGNSATMILEMIAAKQAGVPVRIAHSHNTTCSMKLIDMILRPLFYKLCKGRLACGKEAGKWLFNNNDFVIVKNGIYSKEYKFDPQKREKIRDEYDIEDSIVIGHIGNFNYQKNHKFLIDVFSEINKRQPTSKLLLLGDGPLKDEILSYVAVLKLSDKVFFLGSVDNPHLYMNAMDVVIMPSRFEGLPLTLIEEQANGIPILAADKITQDANVTGDIRYLSLDAAPTIWALQALQLINSTKRNVEISETNIAKIKMAGYDIDCVSKNLIELYHQMLKDNN